MKEIMTFAEIKAKFVSEWVLLEDPELTPNLEVIRGKVLWHSKNRDEFDRKALELMPKHSAIFYTGTIPEGTAVVL
jgi:hypothetical protein